MTPISPGDVDHKTPKNAINFDYRRAVTVLERLVVSDGALIVT